MRYALPEWLTYATPALIGRGRAGACAVIDDDTKHGGAGDKSFFNHKLALSD